MAKSRKKKKRLSPAAKLIMVVCAALMILSGLSELKTMYDLHRSISDTQQKQSALNAEKKRAVARSSGFILHSHHR